jgi:hypothetical protein
VGALLYLSAVSTRQVSTVQLTPRRLNRATLERQMLLERERVPVEDAIARLVGLQAQEPASPYLALWNRIDGFAADDLDRAFATGSIVKASLMRITLHAVLRGDYTTFHEAMVANLRASRLNDRRFRSTGLTTEDADRLLPVVLDLLAEPRTREEIELGLSDHLGRPPEPRLWWAYRTFAPIVHAPTGHPWSFGLPQRFVAGPVEPERDGPTASLQRLVLRYLKAFGPATPEDFAQFALQKRAATRTAFDALADALVTHEGPDGTTLFDVPQGPIPEEDVSAPPRLMAMWDTTLLAYRDRSRILPERHRATVIRRNGNVLPTVWVDGFVAGVWRATEAGIEVLAFDDFSDSVWDQLASEAAGLLEFVTDRDRLVYSRYDHWWEQLPVEGRRILEP